MNLFHNMNFILSHLSSLIELFFFVNCCCFCYFKNVHSHSPVGFNRHLQNDGSSCTVDLNQTDDTVSVLSLGYYASCVVMKDGRAGCWGADISGNLGTGGFGNRGDDLNEMGQNFKFMTLPSARKAIGIKTAYSVTCIHVVPKNTLPELLDAAFKELICVGGNNGALGLGDTDAKMVIGRAESDMGESLQSFSLPSGVGSSVIDFCVSWHVCVLTLDKQIFCAGQNRE